MSKVDRASNAEVLAQMKDMYATRERETETRHRSEVADIRESQKAEIDKLREDSKKRITALEEENGAKLSAKDIQNQKEIDAMRALYSRRTADGRKPAADDD